MGTIQIVSPTHGATLSSPLAIARIRYEGIEAGSAVLRVGEVSHVIELPDSGSTGLRSGEIRENITLLEGDNMLLVEMGAARAEAVVTVPPSAGLTLARPDGAAPITTRATELQGSWSEMSCPAGVVSVNGFLQQFAVTAASGSFDERIVLRPGVNHVAIQVGERYVTRRVQGDFAPARLLATLVWDTNSTDLDLYVGEPDGSTVWYRNKVSSGTLDVDRMQGYGPENYSISAVKAAPGRYPIRVHYFAAREIGRSEWTVRVLANEGQPDQQRRTFYGILDRSLGHQGPEGRGEDWNDVCTVTIDANGAARIDAPSAQGGHNG